ncbi:TetR/AcrR family transcriptional regulator [Janthinobacterium sp. 17J80-10]|uniref:TetR/AcrR family transcriptional regulator n=1 Tax=Janthinobacterium sp. 17J80-10 TaxID=2497863 RepID=UPI0010056D05|nr:TetR/AcrR family transcriptional regulator [Janthinobacterium sp. 17J80-10]QAU33568.1 TetR/AcrR family transcriptional regulator [Janthinobacterium sp. 17J80-10]
MQCPLKSKRWERRKEARPQELLAAALDLFVERGFAATRLDDVASRAGVSKGTLYLYFANKEDLFKAVVRENMLPMIGEAEDMIAQHQGDSASLFQEIMLGWWDRVGNSKISGIPKLIMAESGNFPEVARFYYEEVSSRVSGMILRVLELGIARGEFRPIDTRHALQVVIAPMVMLMLWNQSFGACQMEQISPQDYLRTYIDIYLRGLLQDPGMPLPPPRMPC